MSMQRAILPVWFQEKLSELLIDLAGWRNALFISLLVTNVENNLQVKQTTLFAIGGIITNLTLSQTCTWHIMYAETPAWTFL